MRAGLLAAVLGGCASLAVSAEPPVLPIGEPVAGVIRESDPVAETERLRAYAEGANRRRTYRLRVPDTGAYHVVVRSYFIDPYLILRDSGGKVLTEDDDGWMFTYPRLLLSRLVPGETYLVDVCALHGQTGEYEIRLVRGEPAEVPAEEAQALELAEAKRAVETLEARGVEPLDLARRLNSLARVLNKQDRYEEAKPVFRRALALASESVGMEHVRSAGILANLAETCFVQQNYREARDLYEEARGLFEKVEGENGVTLAFCLNYLGLVYESMGDFEEARPHFERALRIRRAKLGRRDPLLAESLRNLAELLTVMGSYEEARPLYEQAHSIYRRAYGPRDARTAYNLNMFGLLVKKQGEFATAKRLYEDALAVTEASLGPDHEQTAMVQHNLGKLLHEQGDLDEARPILERAVATREEILPDAHPHVAASLNALAMLCLDSGELERATELLERALDIEREMFGPEHPSTVLRLSNLSVARERAGALDEAMSLEMQSLAARRAMLERQLPVLSESERFRWAARQRRSIDHVLSLSRRLGSETGPIYREVLGWKGYVSRGLLQERSWLSAQTDPAMRRLQDELADILAELSGSYFARDTASEQRLEALESLRSRRDEIERLIAARSTKDRSRPDVGPTELARALGSDEALIDFYMYREGAATNLVAFALRAGEDVARVELGPVGEIEPSLEEHLDAIISGRDAALRGIASATPAPVASRSSRLRGQLWEPLLPHLAGVERVFLCTDGALATLPFETLPGNDPGSFLIEDHAFVYLQGGLDLRTRVESEASEARGTLLIGGVDYDAGGANEAGGSDGRSRSSGHAFLALAGTLPEAEELAGLLRDREEEGEDEAEVVLLSGTAATEEQVKKHVVGKRHVHLATHGFFAPEGVGSMLDAALQEQEGLRSAEFADREDVLVGLLPGLLSGVVLAGANVESGPGVEDGILTAEEVSFLDLRGCELVTLSACETGLGSPQGGENLIGLRRSLHLAGARSTVTSMWKVDDSATRSLMRDFYTRLWTGGRSKSDALREAQLALLASNRRRHGGAALPSTWGAFVLEGDWK